MSDSAVEEYQRGLRSILRQQAKRECRLTCLRGCHRRGGCAKQDAADAEECVRSALEAVRRAQGEQGE